MHYLRYGIWQNRWTGIAWKFSDLLQAGQSSGGKIFCTCPDRPWNPPSLLYSDYQVIPRGEVTTLTMKPWKLLQCDIFCVIVFVTLRCDTLALDDGCPMFRDSMLVSSSRFEVFNDWALRPLKIRPPCCLLNVHQSPSDMAPHPRRIKTLTALKWKPKNLHILCNVYFS